MRHAFALQTEALTKLVDAAKVAADNGELEHAENLALQALVGAMEAKDWYLREGEKSPYAKQQLADCFGTIAYVFNSVSS